MFELPESDTPPIKKAMQYGSLAIEVMVFMMSILVVKFAKLYFEAWPEVRTEGEDE